jgi:hypothetical protein
MDEKREERDGFVAIRGADGMWRDRATGMPLPGARDFTVVEYLAPSATFHSEMGEWVDISTWDAGPHEEIHQWCREHAAAYFRRGVYRFDRSVFETAGAQTVPIVYAPELDDPRVYLQQLARTERRLRVARKELDRLERERAARLKVAADHGFSRRGLAAFVGLSFARVQQLIAREERSPG